jgi:anaerobic selenocysteine-containing dehydrogenase
MPVYDLAAAHCVLGVGADFLGGWAAPVYYARQFGHMRQGRPEIRGRLIQAESRMSVTAASADEWLPIRPGSEPQFVMAMMRMLLDAKAARHGDVLPAKARASVEAADLTSLIRATGIEEKRLRRVAGELGESEGALVLAGASTVHTNSLDGLVAAHYLNLMLGAAVKLGGTLPVAQGSVGQALQDARVVLLDAGENPVYTLGVGLKDKDFVVSFANYIDDSTAFADVILPDHHPLEWEAAVVSPVTQSVAVGEQFVRPLYDTRALAQTLGDLAKKMNVSYTTPDIKTLIAAQKPNAEEAKAADVPLQGTTVQASEQFPFEFQPYLSLQYHDGRSANLPWMQEMPDPVSSAMWDLPVEIDPKTAAHLGIANGDRVRVTSTRGSLEAMAYVHPAALPGVISMAIGQGHAHYGRYASGRGANPLWIVPTVWEPATGVRVTGGTRVKLERLGEGELTQFSPQDREQGPWGRSA